MAICLFPWEVEREKYEKSEEANEVFLTGLSGSLHQGEAQYGGIAFPIEFQA